MSTWNDIKGLSGCLNLTALTLYDTPLSLKKSYRHCLINSIWSLKALDNFIISDEEIIQNWSLPIRFKAMNQHFCVSLYPSTKSVSAHYLSWSSLFVVFTAMSKCKKTNIIFWCFLFPQDSFETEMKATYKIISEINRIQAVYSPTLIIQRWIRGHLIRKSIG